MTRWRGPNPTRYALTWESFRPALAMKNWFGVTAWNLLALSIFSSPSFRLSPYMGPQICYTTTPFSDCCRDAEQPFRLSATMHLYQMMQGLVQALVALIALVVSPKSTRNNWAPIWRGEHHCSPASGQKSDDTITGKRGSSYLCRLRTRYYWCGIINIVVDWKGVLCGST